MPQKSAFEIIDIDHTDCHVLVEDRELGITIQVQFERKELIAVESLKPIPFCLVIKMELVKRKCFLSKFVSRIDDF